MKKTISRMRMTFYDTNTPSSHQVFQFMTQMFLAAQVDMGIKYLFLDEYGSFVMAGCAGG